LPKVKITTVDSTDTLKSSSIVDQHRSNTAVFSQVLRVLWTTLAER